MVFSTKGQFQQFPHCKFRENIVRVLYIPSILGGDQSDDDDNGQETENSSASPHLFLVVNKFGKIGIYTPENFSLVHTYCIDLTVPMHAHLSDRLTILSKIKTASLNTQVAPKCERTHLVVDAAYSEDACCIIYATTKSILQWYDIGEIQKLNIGLELFPRKEFMGLYESDIPVSIPNKGHVECHRLFELHNLPTCLEYFCGHSQMGKLLIGDVDGGITIIYVPDPRTPLGKRKVRGKLHKLVLSDLLKSGICSYYKAHHDPVTDMHFLPDRDLILTCSKDRKFSIFVKDIKDTVDSIIVSVPKGVNSLTHSSELKMIATGSDDYIVRLFSQFIMKMPQMELMGHRSSVLAVEFVQLEFMENPILLSYSADSEVRAWDPLTFICLQSLYLTFPIGSTIICKTPEFARNCLQVLLPLSKHAQQQKLATKITKVDKTSNKKQTKVVSRSTQNGAIILLYCNSYAQIPFENQKGSTGSWPFDYDEFIQEFEELSMEYDKKLKEKFSTESKVVHAAAPGDLTEQEEAENKDTPAELQRKASVSHKRSSRGDISSRLSQHEMSQIESKLDDYVKEILELKKTIQQTETNVGGHESKVKTQICTSGNSTGRLSESTFDEHSPIPTAFNISVQATHRFFEFKREKEKNLPRNLRRTVSFGQAFNQYPILDLEPIEFVRTDLPIPEAMKSALGIQSINSVHELGTPTARQYLGIDTAHLQHHRSKKKLSGRGNNAAIIHPKSDTGITGHAMAFLEKVTDLRKG